MNRTRTSSLCAIALAIMVLAACGATAAPTAAPTLAPTRSVQTQPSATAAPPVAPTSKPAATATSAPAPAVGGSIVVALNGEPDKLDAHLTNFLPSETILNNIGATLLALDPAGKYVPWLAESWTVSSDGLTWDFKLRKGVKFHDGTALTAGVYAWTFQRALDPKLASPGAGVRLASTDSVQAVDDSTLRLHLKSPYWALLYSLTLAYCQPLPKDAVERMGDQFARSPIGVGPYKFVEWKTGDRVTLERNADYDWRPAFLKGGPYIRTITFRFITEQSTVSAGLESGSIDFGQIAATDLNRFKANSKVTVYPWQNQGQRPYMLLNNTRFPFDDVRVRQALNYATDREELIEVASQGTGAMSYGPLSENMLGYWSREKDIAYKFDLEKAKDLMKQAGFAAGSDGVLQKDGKALKLTVYVPTNRDVYSKTGQVLKEQWMKVGVDLTLEARDSATVVASMRSGDYTLLLQGYGGADADQLVSTYGSKGVGSNNYPRVQDAAVLDKLMTEMRTTLDAAKHQEAVQALVTHIIQQAYVVWLFNDREFWCISNRLKGAAWSEVTGRMWLLSQAYVETK